MTEPTTLGPNETEINSLLAQSKHTEALKHVLSTAPLGSKDPQAKEASMALALRLHCIATDKTSASWLASFSRD